MTLSYPFAGTPVLLRSKYENVTMILLYYIYSFRIIESNNTYKVGNTETAR